MTKKTVETARNLAASGSGKIRLRQQAAIAEIGRLSLHGVQIGELSQRVVELVAEALDVEFSKILELSPDCEALDLKAGVGWREGEVGNVTVPAKGASQAAYTLLQEGAVVVEDVAREKRFRGSRLLEDHGVVSGVSTVIRGRARPYGVLGAHSRQPREFYADDLHFLQSVGDLLAATIERDRVEQALRASEATNRAIVDTCIDGIITITEQGVISYFNPAAEQIFGHRAEEITGQNVGLLMTEPDRSRHDSYVRRYVVEGNPRVIGIGREVMGKRKDGTLIPVHLSVAEMNLDGERMFTGLVRDLSQFKKVQEELMQAQNLASLGEMAASVAHEVKNPLAAISGVIQILSESEAIAEPYQSVVEELVQRVKRLDHVVKRLLLFAKPMQPDKQAFNLHEVLRQIVSSLQREDRLQGVTLSVGGDRTVMVKLDLILFEDVMRNLVYNAAEAMIGEGAVTISCDLAGSFIRISIADTGPGIAPEVGDKVFRPFFTTKSDGTGLGLSLCRKIVEAHGGQIELVSPSGNGSRIVITLPIQ